MQHISGTLLLQAVKAQLHHCVCTSCGLLCLPVVGSKATLLCNSDLQHSKLFCKQVSEQPIWLYICKESCHCNAVALRAHSIHRYHTRSQASHSSETAKMLEASCNPTGSPPHTQQYTGSAALQTCQAAITVRNVHNHSWSYNKAPAES